MKWPPVSIVRGHTEWGPDAAGATSDNLLPRRPRRGQAAAPLALVLGLEGVKPRAAADSVPTPGPGTDGNHSCGLRSVWGGGRGLGRRLLALQVVDDAPFHAARDRDDLSGDVAREGRAKQGRQPVRRRPRAAPPSAAPSSARCAAPVPAETWPRVIGDSVQPGATAFTRTPGDLRTTSFFRLSSRPPRIGRLGGGVVGVAGLAEQSRSRADENERAVALQLPEETARRQERGREVRVERLAPALERQLPDGRVLAGPDACDRRADVERAGLGEKRVDLRLVRQVGSDRLHRAEPAASATARSRPRW